MLGCLKPPDVDIGAHSDIGAKIETRQSAVTPWGSDRPELASTRATA
jgi:hypothetical protein